MNEASLRTARWRQGLGLFIAGGVFLGLSLNLFNFLWSHGETEFSKVLSVTSPGLWIALAVFYPLLIALLVDFTRVIAQLRSAWMQGFQLTLLSLVITLPCLLLYLFFTMTARMGAVDLESRMGSSVRLLAWLVCILLEPFWALMVLRRLPRLTQAPLCQRWLTRLTGHIPSPPNEYMEPSRRPN